MPKLNIVLAVGPWDRQPWRAAFAAAAPGRQVSVWPDDGSVPGPAPYVIAAWKADPRVFAAATPPAAILSLGAGVDHLGALRERPQIPVGRIVDPDLTARMVEYVVFAVLYLHRRMGHYQACQARREWQPAWQPAAAQVSVGILGFGVLGQACGQALAGLGFQVAGWARSPRPDTAIPVFAGSAGWPAFLGRTQILVNLLPSTPDTVGLIGRPAFERLAKLPALAGAGFVNAGRGDTVVQADLAQALSSGVLAGAVLDVFSDEPLAGDSVLWGLANVLITPHVAADSDPQVVAAQVAADVERLDRGLGLRRPVDWMRGY